MKKSLKTVIQKAETLLQTIKYDDAHDLKHHKRVWEIAKDIALHSRGKVDNESLQIACLWHDVITKKTSKNHEEITLETAEYLKRFMTKLGFNNKKIQRVYLAIVHHEFNKKPINIEGNILFDADKLDAFTPERIFWFMRSKRGKNVIWQLKLSVLRNRFVRNYIKRKLHYDRSKFLFEKRVGLLFDNYKGLWGPGKYNNQDDLLLLTNKRNSLPESYRPNDLVTIDDKIPVIKRGMRLRLEAAKQIKLMNKAANKNNVSLIVLSAYRSFHTQEKTFNAWVKEKGVKEASTFSAKPGQSQHQLGTTVDFTSPSQLLGFVNKFERTKESKWLAKNAWKFGFILSYPDKKEKITGYAYEPWHYRYIGVENAWKMKISKLILEEFLQRL